MNFEKVPQELRNLPQWVCRRGKIPFDPRTGRAAKAGKPETWNSFDTCITAIQSGKYDGIGFEFANNGGIVGIDLDHVVNLDTKEIEPWAKTVLDKLDSYTEYSPSGTGLHIFVKGTLPPGKNKRIIDDTTKQAIEIYDRGRYFTITGDALYNKAISEKQTELYEICTMFFANQKSTPTVTPERLSAPEYLRRGLDKDNGLRALWDGHRVSSDESSNDMALMNKLAYWCNRDTDQMIEAFRSSPFAKQKDEEHQNKILRNDYLLRTAQEAAQSCNNTAAADDEAYRLERAKKAFSPKPGKTICPSDFTDVGNATVFAEYFKDELLFTDSLGWLRWDGKVWDNSDHHATKCATQLSSAMLDEAKQAYLTAVEKETELKSSGAGDPVSLIDESGNLNENSDLAKATSAVKSAKAYFAWAQKTRSRSRIEAMIALAKPQLYITAAELDPNPFDLNTPSGIVDLQTGKIRSHDPLARCTRITQYAPGTKGSAEWKDFLQTVCGEETDFERYLQRLFGLSVIGRVYEESAYLAYGSGRNGKSTTVNAIAAALGDYAGTINVDVLTTDMQNKGAALATLRGKRLVTAGELEEHQRLSGAMLKRITSTDPITIEMKYKQPESINPTHTLVLSTNHLPRVGSRDRGTWRRIRILPFIYTVSKKEDILNYAKVLGQNCGESIVSWVIEGAKQVIDLKYKIPLPLCVQDATNKYRQEEDWLQNFIAECCDTTNMNSRTQASELYAVYQSWAKSANEYVRRQTEFSQAIESEGYRKVNVHGTKYICGIKPQKESAFPQYRAL